MVAFPELDLTVVVTTTHYGRGEAHDWTERMVEQVLAAVRR